jgi:hypothetical protein
MEFIQDDHEDILYWVDKQIDYYYLSSIQPSYITRKKNIDKVPSFQSRKFQHHLNDNNTTTNTIHLLILKKKSELVNSIV